jgi:hypothetical protein
VSHLLFADDTLLFFKAEAQQADKISELIATYAKSTGQLINMGKCSIMFGKNCPAQSQDNIRTILHLQNPDFEDKYLGLPTPQGRMSKGKLQNLQVRLTKRFMEWGDSFPSQAAKETLIKSIAESIPTYIMSVFKLPMALCDDLNRMIRNYWWGSKKGKRKTHWKSWDAITHPKRQGGLGFKDFRLFNQALLARQAWRLLTKPESLYATVLKARYYPNGRLEDTVFAGNASSTWQAIQYGLELIKKGLVWRVGDGSQIRIWRDPWLPRPPSYRPISNQGDCRLRRVAALITEDATWNQDLLNKYFRKPDVDEILKINLSPQHNEDVLAWGPDIRGIFSVRSAYKLAWEENHRTTMCAASRAPDGHRTVWDTVWGCPAPPKVRVFAWRVATNGLATWENKMKRKIVTSDTCIICGMEREDTFHVLCRCPMSRDLWEAMREVWPLAPIDTIVNTGPEWILQASDQATEQERLMMMMTWWRAWHVRNEVVHHNPAPPVVASRRFLCSYVDSLLCIKQSPSVDPVKGKTVIVHDHKKVRPSKKDLKPQVQNKWTKPPPGWSKLNIDGSWSEEYGVGVVGMVLRDEMGKIIVSACMVLPNCNYPLEAELRACSDGLNLGMQWTDTPMIIESDCLVAIQMITDKEINRSKLAFWVNSVKHVG